MPWKVLMGIKRSWTPMVASRWEHFDGAACAGRRRGCQPFDLFAWQPRRAGHPVT